MLTDLTNFVAAMLHLFHVYECHYAPIRSVRVKIALMSGIICQDSTLETALQGEIQDRCKQIPCSRFLSSVNLPEPTALNPLAICSHVRAAHAQEVPQTRRLDLLL